MGRPETPVGTGLRRSLEAPPGRVVNRGGWVGRKSLPPAGAGQVRADPRLTVPMAIGSIIGSWERSW